MKVSFLTNSLAFGGAERTIVALSDEFTRKGVEVEIVVYGNKVSYDVNNNVKVKVLNLGMKYRILRIFYIIRRFYIIHRYYKKNSPDVIFCMLSNSFLYTVFLRKKIKVITSERANPKNENKKNLFFRKFAFKRSDGVVFQTKRAQDFYMNINKNSVVIQNAVGNPSCYNDIEVKSYENKITAMGRLTIEKDYFTLLRAFELVHNKFDNYILEIYGEGILKDELISFTKELKIDKYVHFMGTHKDAIEKIRNSKCFVLSSKSEGMPNALLEAMSIGLPCVSTNCDFGPAEIIQNNENGLLVDVGDYKALSNAIIKFLETPSLAEKCGNNASKLLKSNSLVTIGGKYLKFIEYIVST